MLQVIRLISAALQILVIASSRNYATLFMYVSLKVLIHIKFTQFETCVHLLSLYGKIELSRVFKLRVGNRKIFFLLINRNICCGYLKEPFQ